MSVPCHEGPPATEGHFSSEPAVAGRGRYYCTHEFVGTKCVGYVNKSENHITFQLHCVGTNNCIISSTFHRSIYKALQKQLHCEQTFPFVGTDSYIVGITSILVGTCTSWVKYVAANDFNSSIDTHQKEASQNTF